jgi:hypothetical protein
MNIRHPAPVVLLESKGLHYCSSHICLSALTDSFRSVRRDSVRECGTGNSESGFRFVGFSGVKGMLR